MKPRCFALLTNSTSTPTSTTQPGPLLRRSLTAEQILDVLLLAGWYHAISYAANAARVALEDGAPHFADFV